MYPVDVILGKTSPRDIIPGKAAHRVIIQGKVARASPRGIIQGKVARASPRGIIQRKVARASPRGIIQGKCPVGDIMIGNASLIFMSRLATFLIRNPRSPGAIQYIRMTRVVQFVVDFVRALVQML